MQNYISIRSVMSDISTLLGEDQIDEGTMLEWATKGLRKINAESKLTNKVVELEVEMHRAQLPSDLIYLQQVMQRTGTSSDNISGYDYTINGGSSKSTSCFMPMRLTTNLFHKSICLPQDQQVLSSCVDCMHEFGVSPNMCVTTTLKEGTIQVAYLTYPTDEEGYALIPNDEDLKEALVYYILYRYWLVRFNTKEDGAENRVKFYQGMWQALSTKSSGKLNLPNLSQLESLKNIQNRLVPKEDGYNRGFSTIGSNETRNF